MGEGNAAGPEKLPAANVERSNNQQRTTATKTTTERLQPSIMDITVFNEFCFPPAYPRTRHGAVAGFYTVCIRISGVHLHFRASYVCGFLCFAYFISRVFRMCLSSWGQALVGERTRINLFHLVAWRVDAFATETRRVEPGWACPGFCVMWQFLFCFCFAVLFGFISSFFSQYAR